MYVCIPMPLVVHQFFNNHPLQGTKNWSHCIRMAKKLSNRAPTVRYKWFWDLQLWPYHSWSSTRLNTGAGPLQAIHKWPTVLESGSLESFVDNSKLHFWFTVKDATAVGQLINEDLVKITTWCCYNGLLINSYNTKLLVMGNGQMLLRKDFMSLHPTEWGISA